MNNVSKLHPQFADERIRRQITTWCWDTHPWSRGAFAFFTPGQHTNLHRDIIASEGRIVFAGEHTSLSHAWMQGALESGLRAVTDVLAAAVPNDC